MRDIQTKRKNDFRRVIRKILGKNFSIVIKLILIFFLLNVIYPKPGSFFTSMREGDIAQQDIIAPFTFPVKKDPEEIKRERKKAIESVLPVVDYDEDKTQDLVKKIENFFVILFERKEKTLDKSLKNMADDGYNISKNTVTFLLRPEIREKREKLKEILFQPIEKGIIYDKSRIPYMKEKRISVRKSSGEIIYSSKDFYSLDEAKDLIKNKTFSYIKRDEEIIKAMDEVTILFYTPNLRINVEETEKRRKEASASVSETKGLVLKGEMIVRAHDQITKQIALKLNSLNEIVGQKKSILENIFLRLGLNILLLLLLFVLYFYIIKYKNYLWRESEKLLMIEIVMLIFLYLASLLFKLEHIFLFLIPLSFLAMVFTMLFGEIFSMVICFVLASILAIFTGMRFPVFIFLMVSSIAGIFSVKGINRRAKLYKALFIISVTNMLLVFGIESFSRTPIFSILMGTSFGFINAVVSVFLLVGLLPLFEKFTETTTDITLFEWSDLNLPLLKKLSVTAPGTYNHSIIVGNLAEAAAESIGVDSILTRVASYYHDIGKMLKSEYFIENQMGIKNPHNKLTPQLSCIILISHVKEGIEIAQRAGLPNEIIKIIREHHGSSLIVPFFEKAKKQNHKEKVDESQFRYPGPSPSTKESGIVMLADSVEAASRSLEEPNAKRLKSLINEIIEERFRDGQLNNSQLTLVDLKKIGESFLPILVGMYHLRVEYP
ncbi:HDIG domain-containing protein [candidate division WOR-3 bacterium]|nr:HDIG domain-containing protein [candidate division WOR-3 bacterium]TET77308.1 MAG: HDIG domain-containing protein [Candidatus Cloacimonadota bacterium]